MSEGMSYHGVFVHPRRVKVLAETAARLIPANLEVLDIGCGDGLFAATLARLRPDLSISGAELIPRADCRISVTAFDGHRLPFADCSFGAAILVDVLHHTLNPGELLREADRVTRDVVLLKDHFRDGLGAHATLRFMDRIGNRRFGVPLPYNYLSPDEWSRLFADCGLVVDDSDHLHGLYPFPANLLFGRRLHFFARLRSVSNSEIRLSAQP